MMETQIPEVEVSPKATRRKFSAEYKRRILSEVDACLKPSEVGALLRREGLWSSLISRWRRAIEKIEVEALEPKKRGPPARVPNPLEKEVTELKRALAKAESRAERAEALVELQKKVAEICGIQLPRKDETP